MVRQIEAGRSVAIFPEGALSPLAGGIHPTHSGVGRVALRTGALVIPVGIGLRCDRIRVIEARLDGEKTTGHLYTRGPYAITVGRALTFAGDAENPGQVRAVADQIMHHVQDLARETERRIRPAQVTAAGKMPNPVRAASVAGAPASVRRLP